MNDTTTSIPGERDVRLQVPLWRLTGTFTLVTPLHVGTGRDAEIRLDEARMGSDKETRAPDESRYVATVVRDHQDRPCIPASSFKGALAALARRVADIDAAQHERLFGAVKGDKTASGGVEFTYLYAQPDTLPETSGLPQFGRPAHAHVAHLAHVSRNRDTGAAEAQRLFLSQVVPPGVVFGFECTARGLSREDVGVLLGLLDLAADGTHGLRLGAGKAADQGRVSWQQGEVWCLEADKLAALWASGDGRIWTDRTLVRGLEAKDVKAASGDWLRLDGLELKFHSPFLVYERRKKEVKGDPDGGPRTNHAGRVMLPSTSLHGALRAQAERILRTIGQKETAAGYAVPSMQGLVEAGKVLDLASVLFGAPGWRSLLRCSDFVDDGKSEDITHHMLAIDRLTGGGKDKFSIDVRDCPTLIGSLAVDLVRLRAIEKERQGVTAQVLGLLAHVLRDLDEGDIPLGYGASKGYGQLHSGTVNQFIKALPVSDLALTTCLESFAKLFTSSTTTSPPVDDIRSTPYTPIEPAAAPSRGDGYFHNPYAHIPFGKPRIATKIAGCEEKNPLPWQDHASLSRPESPHSHARYGARLFSGRLICKLRTSTPLFIGAGEMTSTDKGWPGDPVKKELKTLKPFRLGKQNEYALPATSLRGMISSLHESITQSALRVMDTTPLDLKVPGRRGETQRWSAVDALPDPRLAPLGNGKHMSKLAPSELLFGVVENRKQATASGAYPATSTLKTFMSKVRFGHARGRNVEALSDFITLKILSEPKLPSPLTYMHSPGSIKLIRKSDFLSQPDSYKLRGRKAYLHPLMQGPRVQNLDAKGKTRYQAEALPPWQTRYPEDSLEQKVRIQPIKAQQTFYYGVDFSNLTSSEFDSLCAALQPSAKFQHKLGMGKPIGLGSVKQSIVAVGFVDRHKRYQERTFEIASGTNRQHRYHICWHSLSPFDLNRQKSEIPDDLIDDMEQALKRASPDTSSIVKGLGSQSMKRLHKNEPDVFRALQLIGNPDHVKAPVHYPQCEGNDIENEHFKWFMAAEKRLPRNNHEPITADTGELPIMTRTPGMTHTPGQGR